MEQHEREQSDALLESVARVLIATGGSTVSMDWAARVLEKQDPMSRLSTSAAEAAKAFQDLQDMAASSPLGAGQIRKDTDILASFHGVSREPWYKRLWSWLRGTK